MPVKKDDTKYYKIVYRCYIRHKLVSMQQGSGSVEYEPNQWTVPLENHGPLAVLSDKSQALFLGQQIDYHVYECDIVKSRKRSLWKLLFNEYSKEKTKHVYRLEDIKIEFSPSTVLADKVRITKRIDV